MKEFNLQGHQDQSIFEYLKKSYDIQENIIKKNSRSKEEQEGILRPLHLAFSRNCLSQHSHLLSLLPPMTIALRSELENDDDSEIFVIALNENILRMNKVYENMFTEETA